MDIVSSATKTAERNRYTVVAAVVAVVLNIWLQGCQSKTASPFSGLDVTAGQLDAEITAYNAEQESLLAIFDSEVAAKRIAFDAEIQHDVAVFAAKHSADNRTKVALTDAARLDIRQQDEFKASLMDTIKPLLATGLGATGLAGLGIGGLLLGGGAAMDNLRKNGQIKRRDDEIVVLRNGHGGGVPLR